MTSDAQNKEPSLVSNDEIDFIAVFQILTHSKWQIILITFLFTLSSIIYALMQPNIYKSTALLVPAEGAVQPKSSQLQGLASIAGINVSSTGTDKTDIAIATLESHQFIKNFIDRKKIIIPLMAIKGWDKSTDTPIFDQSIYDHVTSQWKTDNNEKPSDLIVYEKFKSILSISKDTETGFVEVSIYFPVPKIAQEWAAWLVEDINQYSREKDIKQSSASIEYLNIQLNKTQIADIRTIFFQLIKDETQKILLAETRDEYIFEMIDPPIVPEIKDTPKRALIVIISTILGGLLSLIITLGRHIYKNSPKPL